MAVIQKKKVTKSIGFYHLRVKKLRTPVNDPVFMGVDNFINVINFIRTLPNEERLVDIEMKGRKKFHFLKAINVITQDCYHLIFSSAKYEYRPPVIDKQTLETKDNPRSMTEGDEELTHVKLYIKKDYVLLLIEERINGITARGITQYFNDFKHIFVTGLKKDFENQPKDIQLLLGDKPDGSYRFSTAFVPNNNFTVALHGATKIGLGHIYIEKDLIHGSEFARYSNKMKTYTSDLQITLKATDDLIDMLDDYYNEYTKGTSHINRMKVEVYDDLGKKSIIDTELFKLRKTIEVETNIIDGVIISDEMFIEMSTLI
ncbi:hypothetical protein CTM88_05970 [Photobacterium aquimaris]|uniref:Uncharacterized protein n=1 Tax=Photobacterium aquimaris TaxID=512643 RepID=A0A2T3INU7_9GAMM|nr:hypothetical protein [Photobacterium aquimaris]OBU22252.1 hypothetical protein AYY20_11965 [Photobacterium aquimaris]PSU30019.1 hypothetical protein CTM88_05970 [Photobacterium aquimaris]